MIGSPELMLTCVIISNVYNESFRAPLSHIRVGEQLSSRKISIKLLNFSLSWRENSEFHFFRYT
jgi:hypothetical protein